MNDSLIIHGMSIDEIPHRKPILDNESAKNLPDEVIGRQWLFISEAIKREIQTNPVVREAVSSLVAQPVDQLLAAKLVLNVARVSQRIELLAKRFSNQVIKYISLPEAPEEAFQPDFQHTSYLNDPKHQDYLDESWGKSLFDRDLKAGRFLSGVTSEEKQLAINRYRFSRDAKLLILTAAFMDEQPKIKDGEQKLASGIEFHAIATTENQALFEPINWVKRKMIKDRVYEIEVGRKKYILKERKTSRHTDTKRGGHRDGLLSKEEFQVANDLPKKKLEAEKIMIEWEKPIAYVTFPDGFQFAIFEFEDELLDIGKATEVIYQNIMENKDQFKKEHQEIAKLLKKFAEHKLLKTYRRNLFLGHNLRLSFESYARVKSIFWQHLARERKNEVVLETGYGNSDLDGYAFKVNKNEGNELQLEIFGMDFEYFYKMSDESIDRAKKIRSSKDERISIGDFEKQIFHQWWDERKVTAVEQAAYLAFFDKYQL